MGQWISKFTKFLSALGTNHVRILLLGLDGVGKTTILYKLKRNEIISTFPTNGFNVEELTPVKNITFTMWDIGRHEKFRQILRHYYEGSKGVIFVIDASDVSRIGEARDELFSILMDEGMEKGIPVITLANKQDLPNALNSYEIMDKMGLEDLKSNPWYVQEMSAWTGDGLYEGINMMADMVKTFQSEKDDIP